MRIRVGIIGCGKIAQTRHLPEYAANPQAELVGYYDLNRARAEEAARQYGGRAYGDYHALLADPAVDAVSVLTSNDSHARISIEALEAGKHVLCEKPMATTLEDCEAMAAASARTGKALMIGHNQRLAGAHAKARKLIEEGAVGRVVNFRTSFGHGGPERWSVDGADSWFFNRERAFLGVMADLGVHKVDLIQFLTGQQIAAVRAWLGTLDKRAPDGSPIAVDDNAICICELDGGAVGTVTASWTYYGAEENATVLYGTRGVLRLYDDPAHSVVLEARGGERTCFDAGAIQTNDLQTSSGVIDRFVGCLVRGIAPEISGREALSAMRAVFAAVESGRTGRRVEL